MGKVKSSQKSRKRMRESTGKWYSVFEGCWNPSWVPDLERPLWQTGVMSLEGETTDTSHNRGEAWFLRPNEDHFGQCPSRGMLGLSPRPFDAGNHSRGKEEILMHTHKKKCQCTHCKNNTQQAQSLDVREWSTAKIKLMPQGQRDRPHWRKCTARNKFVPQGQWNRPH